MTEELKERILKFNMMLLPGQMGMHMGTSYLVNDLEKALKATEKRVKEAEADNPILRKLLWLRHGDQSHILYGDDGEMQCNLCMINFM